MPSGRAGRWQLRPDGNLQHRDTPSLSRGVVTEHAATRAVQHRRIAGVQPEPGGWRCAGRTDRVAAAEGHRLHQAAVHVRHMLPMLPVCRAAVIMHDALHAAGHDGNACHAQKSVCAASCLDGHIVTYFENTLFPSGDHNPSSRRKNAVTGVCTVVTPHSRVLSNTVFDVSPRKQRSSCRNQLLINPPGSTLRITCH